MNTAKSNLPTPIPVPKAFFAKEECFAIAPVIAAPKEYIHCANVLQTYLRRIFHIEFYVIEGTTEKGICLCVDEALVKEAYSVCAENGLVCVRASETSGFSHGCSTILQMAELCEGKLQICAHEINDHPDIGWRGLMVDIARASYSLEELLAFMDICYYYRLSVVHLHFADGMKYKLPSAAFPKFDMGETYPHHQLEIMKKYLANRGLLLIPEIEMPGHAMALTEIYPEVFGKTHTGTVCGTVCLGAEKLFWGLETLIDEVCAMFPDAPYIHIGCDEVDFKDWEKCPHCQEFMKKTGLASAKEAYTYMVDRCTRMVLAKGRTPIVWEGFPREGTEHLSRDILVMPFQSIYQNAIELTDAGFKVVNTSWQPLYIVPSRPKYWEPDYLYRWKVNKWLFEEAEHDEDQPMIVEKKDAVLGAQLCLWEGTHFKAMEGPIVERDVAAVAERLWNEEYQVDYDTFAERYAKVSAKLMQIIEDSLVDL